MNAKRYIRYWQAVILAAIIISLMGCYAPAEVYETRYFDGGVWVENDTIVGGDSLFIWKHSK